MERRGLLWMVLLVLCLSLCACGGKNGEKAPEGQNGEETDIRSEETTVLLLERLGPAEEEISLPADGAMALDKVCRLAGGSELRYATDSGDRATPAETNLLCVATDAAEICGIKVGDSWTAVVESFWVDAPVLTKNSRGEEVWLLYGEITQNKPHGFLALDGEGRPSYVFYGDGASLWFVLDGEGAVREIWYSRDGSLGGHYTAPETLYPYAELTGAGAAACRGQLQNDVLMPVSAEYLVQEESVITVSYQMPLMESGDRFTMDRTKEMQDAAALFLSCPEAETVQFVYHYPLYDYTLTETPITRAMAQEAVGAAIAPPDSGDWSNFDRRLRETYWDADALDAVDFDHMVESAGDPLRNNAQDPLTVPMLGNAFPWSLSEDTVEQYLGACVSLEDIPLFDGAAAYRILTYAGGSMAGGWVGSGGAVESIGALYLTGEAAPDFCGVRIGDSADTVLRSFRVRDAREANLIEYGEDLAIVLYGEVIHMGTYGYAVMEGERFIQIVYGAGETGVVTFFLDGEEKVSAIRFQMEDNMRLPPS